MSRRCTSVARFRSEDAGSRDKGACSFYPTLLDGPTRFVPIIGQETGCSENESAFSQERWVVVLGSVAEALVTAWSVPKTDTKTNTRKSVKVKVGYLHIVDCSMR